MNPEEIEKLAEHDRGHWWYRGLQGIVMSLASPALARVSGSKGSEPGWILDAGCGTGGMLSRLEHIGKRVGVDLSWLALSRCRERVSCPLCQGSIERLPFADATFELVLCTDVIYHAEVGDDCTALSELARVMKPGGMLVVNVPAYEFLRSTHDVAIHTRRRYTRRQIVDGIRRAGLRVVRASYWNTLLFAPAAFVRVVRRWRWRWRGREAESDLRPVPSLVNMALYAVVVCERIVLRWVNLPFGLSVLCTAVKE